MTTDEKDAGARVAAYAEAIADPNASRLTPRLPHERVNDWTARAVMAVADVELAGLRDEVERMRAGSDPTPRPENAYPTAGQLWHTLTNLDADERLERLDKLIESASTGEFLRHRNAEARAEAAEARLRAVEALADEWEAIDSDGMTLPWPLADALMQKAASDLRAALTSVPSGGVAPTEQAGEGGEG